MADKRQLFLRVSPESYAALQRIAEGEGRSVRMQATVMLEAAALSVAPRAKRRVVTPADQLARIAASYKGQA